MRTKVDSNAWKDRNSMQIIAPMLIAILTFSSLGWHVGTGEPGSAQTRGRWSATDSRLVSGRENNTVWQPENPVQARKIAVPGQARKEVVGWLPGWDQQEGLKTFSANPQAVSQVSPFWYGFGAGGEIQSLAGADDTAVKDEARKSERAIMPTVTNDFDGPKASTVLGDPAKRATHIAGLVSTVESSSYTGIDIDYEAMAAADRGAFSDFITQLAAALHERGKLLSVTVHPKVSEPGTWSGPQSMDYVAIGKVADQVRIMAYDQHYPGGPPGPIAPLDWVDKVLEFAVTQVPKEKLFLGVPSYAYDWAGAGRGKPLMLDNAIQLAADKGAQMQWDAQSASPHFDYDEGGVAHTVWLENEQSLAAKIELTKRYDIAGIAIWRLGRQPDSTWKILSEQLR